VTKAEIDRLGDRLRAGPITPEDRVLLAAFRSPFIVATENATRKVLSLVTSSVSFAQRPEKSTLSIISKLRRETTRLSQIQDIGGLRIIVNKVRQQDELVRAICASYAGSKVFDRRPKPTNGYRAVHVIVFEDGLPVEVQVRTRLQNSWAQLSEKLADRYGFELKYGGGDANQRERLSSLSRLVERVEELEPTLDALKRATINELLRKRRAGSLSGAERQRLVDYLALRDTKRQLHKYINTGLIDV